MGATPVGTVVAFAGPVQGAGLSAGGTVLEAQGWMFCDGRTLDASQYPQLFAVLGYVYGGGAGQFAIPDYRGYFLRGNSAGSDVDPDRAARTLPQGGQGSADGVGSLQACAVQTHEHLYPGSEQVPLMQPGAAPAPAYNPALALTRGGPTSSTTPPGDVHVSDYETRPVNVYVNYIIKFT